MRERTRAGAAVLLVGLTLGATSTAQAALPPYWQSASEIEAILKDGRVHDALKYEEPIVSIGLQDPTSDDRVYVLTTLRCTLLVSIVYGQLSPGRVGPAEFDLDIGEATCR